MLYYDYHKIFLGTFAKKKQTNKTCKIVCGENGHWLGKIPECKPIRCSSEPSDIKNLGFITLETPYEPILHGEIPFRYKDKLNLYCERGFKRLQFLFDCLILSRVL